MILIPQATELRNDHVTLVPISLEHAADFLAIGSDPEIWTYMTATTFETIDDATGWVESRIAYCEQTGSVAFSVFDNGSGQLAGSSTCMTVPTAHATLEIGYTWYGADFRRTHVNTATKMALLGHAFDALRANRVEFQTDIRNNASQKALERIGAVREGVLRQNRTYPDGFVRDSMLYSVTRDEWPDVMLRIRGLLVR
jgi:RimJ/RimL family protein N-acetyltransferase